MSPEDLAQVLRHLPKVTHPDLLVGLDSRDDAAVYKVSDDIALISTVDFFPPIVDDPFTYGEIAAANALSDVYAMGGRPLFALNIVGFPADLSLDILGRILAGGASKAAEADVVIAGGHTISDDEPKYGLAVTGVVAPGAQVTNAGARSGDILVLTKPIGTGVIATAGKQQAVAGDVLAEAIRVMATLNRAASEAMVRVGVHACVDVTGFGLLGHLRLMIEASGVGARVRLGDVPLLPGARSLAERAIVPGGTQRNRRWIEAVAAWDPAVPEPGRVLLCDAQTSGGLLIATPPDRLQRLLDELRRAGVETTAVIGEISAIGAGASVIVSP